MEKIHIFADSCADIPKELCERYRIEIVPVTIEYDNKSIREYYDISPEEYWDVLQTSSMIPQTSQITPALCYDTYKRAKAQGYTHVMGVVINAAGSGGYQSACIARDLFYSEEGTDMVIELIDSESYAYLYGHIVVNAAKMRDDGESFEAIVAVTKSRLSRVEGFLGVYSLKHLKKSGRISGGAAFVGEALGLRPISHVISGRVDVCDKVRGDKNLIPRMVEKVMERVVSPETQTAYLLYAVTPEEHLKQAETLLLTKAGFQAVERYPIGASVTTNAGPLAVAIFFYGKPRK